MGNNFYRQSILPHSGILIKLCRAYTNSDEDFEDYYQEVCLQIWRSKDNFKGQCLWSTWLYKVTLNVCLTFLKKAKQSPIEFVSDPLPEGVETDAAFEQSSEINRLYAAIKQLSEVDRAIILLYLEEKTYLEIAEITGSNVNNIGVRITRIKTQLNKRLGIEE
ncbi:RNA polymerase sigma factor [Thalassotalea ganghwensis]